MNFEWDKETQKKFEEMQEKFREDVTRHRDDMQNEDSAVSKFEHQVDMMCENFRRMKHNCF